MSKKVNKTDNWDEIKKIVSTHPRHSLDGMCEQYEKLDALGAFSLGKAGAAHADEWWKTYEKEMIDRGLIWEECYTHFPLIIKFLYDISEKQVGFEKFEASENIDLFEGILYPKGTDGSRSKRMKFIQCILEMCGLAIIPTKGFQKMYCLIGKGQDGKSVLLSLFDKVMNNCWDNANHVGHTPIDELGDKFALQSLYLQTCNICDDINTRKITNTGIIKTLIGAGGTGASITVPRKNMTDYNWTNPQILLILAGNCLPNFEDTTKGMMRRLIYIPFKNSLKDNAVDIYMTKKLCLNQYNLDFLFGLRKSHDTRSKA